MRAFENLLVPGSTETPECTCGAEMRLFATKPRGDTEVRVFRCDVCHHEFQLMVWADADAAELKAASAL
ncbi:MAG TPA: hypothetical protein VMI47_04485 [Pseudolabrys sp.]|nr:hypothetical protein [Pseudolabrys sp.]